MRRRRFSKSFRNSAFGVFFIGSLAHGGYLLSLMFLVVVGVPVLLPLLLFPSLRKRICRVMLQGFLVFFTRSYLPFFKVYRLVEISGLNLNNLPKGVVCVANHRSAIDALLLMPMLYPAAVVLKSKHARKPGYAALVWLFDFVAMKANSLDGLRRGLDKCRALLGDGINLLVFPEGSRSSSRRLLPFADFAFRLACERNVPILPVLIHSDRPFLNRQKGSCFPRQIVEYRIRFLEPLLPAETGDAFRLATMVRGRMSEALAELDEKFYKPAV